MAMLPRLGALLSWSWDQTLGGWNGGAEEMPKRVVAARLPESVESAKMDRRPSARLPIASGVGAQTEAIEQFGGDEFGWATVP